MPPTYLERHPAPWSWDDEDGAEMPYIHIYSDNGFVVGLTYLSDEDRADYAEFAHAICELVNHIPPNQPSV